MEKKIQIQTTKRNEENIKKLIDKGIEQKQQNLFIKKRLTYDDIKI